MEQFEAILKPFAEKKRRSNFAIAEQKTVKLHKKMSRFCGNGGFLSKKLPESGKEICLKCAQRLEQETPEEQRKGTKSAGDNDERAGKLHIAAQLAGHGKGGNGGRGGEHTQQRRKFHTPEAKAVAQRQEDSGHDQQLHGRA